ncbi:hypothetical protein D3C83_184600 [compost metagenome]
MPRPPFERSARQASASPARAVSEMSTAISCSATPLSVSAIIWSRIWVAMGCLIQSKTMMFLPSRLRISGRFRT